MPERSETGGKRILPAVTALVLYVLLTLGFTFPLIAEFGTHVPGTDIYAFDEYTFVYNLWWFKYATLDLGINPLYSSHIWMPVGINFVLYTFALFNAAISLPLQPILGIIISSNLVIVFSIAMSGMGTFLLVRYLLKDSRRVGALTRSAHWWAPFVAGVIYAFAANRFVYLALGHYDLVSTEWIPFFVLFLLKTMREKRWINPVLAGLFATFAMLCEMIFGVFLGMLAIILFLFEVWPGREEARTWQRIRGQLVRLGLLGVFSAITYAPVLLAILSEVRKGYLLAGWGGAVKLSADLLSFVTPSGLNPLFGRDWHGELNAVLQGTARFSDVNTVIVGWGVIALALLACLVSWRKVKAWAVTALTFAVLCLGPLLQINGRYRFDLNGLETTVPLPFIILHYIPIVQGNRAPNRNSVILLLAMAVLVGYGVAWLLERLKRQDWQRRVAPALSICVSGMMLIEHIAVPTPLTDARVPAYYYQLAEEPGDFALLSLPLGWRNSFGMLGAEDTRTQYYQSVHHKRLLSGNSGRHEDFRLEYYESIPFFKALTDIKLYHEVDAATTQLAEQQGPALVYLYDLRYFVVNPPVPGRPPYIDTWQDAERFVLQTMPVETPAFYDQGGMRVYRIIQPESRDGFRIDLGEAGWEPYRGEGWDRNEEIAHANGVWATAQGARVFLPLRDTKDRTLTIQTMPFDFVGASPQTLEVRLNSHPLEPTQTLASGWEEYSWRVPASYQLLGLNEITFHFGWLNAPRDVLPANTAIGTTGVHAPLDIEINSTGAEAGDFAYITIGSGRRAEDGSIGRRGYNISVLDPKDGHILEKVAFDTAANPYESEEMARYLQRLAEGTIVVVAMRGNGAQHLTDSAIDALQKIGSGVDPRSDPTRSHALVGVKGAPLGSAAEAWEPHQSWLRIGRNPDDRTLAVAVNWLRLE